jgi:hypothetical protein
MKITIIATGFEKKPEDAKRRVVVKPVETKTEAAEKKAEAYAAPKAAKNGNGLDDDEFMKMMEDMFGNKK